MGSLSQHLDLMDALDAYESAQKAATFLKLPEGWTNEERKYLRLVSAARDCGYEWSSSETTLEWARRRARSFVQSFPNNAAQTMQRLSADVAAHRRTAR